MSHTTVRAHTRRGYLETNGGLSAKAFIPRFGPCKGHECDLCRVCLAGKRCCGDNNPPILVGGVAPWERVFIPLVRRQISC